jgi:hypothetical protein
MRNRHPGPCYFCSKTVAAGDGHFERHNRGWRVIHADCVFHQRVQKEQHAKIAARAQEEHP